MGAISPLHLILILVVALLVLGPGKLPETGAALGRAIREFRDAVEGRGDEPAGAGAGERSPSGFGESTDRAGESIDRAGESTDGAIEPPEAVVEPEGVVGPPDDTGTR